LFLLNRIMHATLLGQQHVQFAHQLHQGHNFGLLAALLCALGLNSITNCALRFQIAMVLIKRCNIVPPRSRTHGASTPSFRSRSERTSLHDSVARLGIKENDKKKKERETEDGEEEKKGLRKEPSMKKRGTDRREYCRMRKKEGIYGTFFYKRG